MAARRRAGKAALWAERLPARRHDPKDILELRRRLVAERREMWAERFDGAEMPLKLAEQQVDAILDRFIDREHELTVRNFLAASHPETPFETDEGEEEDDIE